jgi:hypothetical protein
MFHNLSPDDKPITSITEYQEARILLDELDQRVHSLLLEIKRQRDSGQTPAPALLTELDSLDSQEKQTRYTFYRRLPYILVSRCPYCDAPVWLKAGIFSLNDNFWYHPTSDGHLQSALKDTRCEHLFCVDGALNLNGHMPTEVRGSEANALVDQINMAAEVPFVKPRVLNLSTMRAVVHCFPVAERYTAYPIAYFTEQRQDSVDFCVAWAATEYIGPARQPGCALVGKRSDAQDYDIDKWVRQGKLLWLDPLDDEHPISHSPAESFPYSNIPGRRHPYFIKLGQIHDLPSPTGGGLTYHIEDQW